MLSCAAVHEGVLVSLVQSLNSWMNHANDRDLPTHTVDLYKVCTARATHATPAVNCC